jgi:hypothetical protein
MSCLLFKLLLPLLQLLMLLQFRLCWEILVGAGC